MIDLEVPFLPYGCRPERVICTANTVLFERITKTDGIEEVGKFPLLVALVDQVICKACLLFRLRDGCPSGWSS